MVRVAITPARARLFPEPAGRSTRCGQEGGSSCAPDDTSQHAPLPVTCPDQFPAQFPDRCRACERPATQRSCKSVPGRLVGRDWGRRNAAVAEECGWQTPSMARDFLPDENDLSTDELFALVHEDLREGQDARLRPLIALHGRPTRAVVERCRALCRSSEAHDRIVGLRVLRELKHQLVDSAVLWAPIEPTVLELATREDDPEVLQWAISCLGYQANGPLPLAAVLGRVDHTDSRIRYAVAAALPALVDPGHPEEEAVSALLRLAEDIDADVRSYALMGLTLDLDLAAAPEVRSSLERHVDDPDEQIRRHVRSVLDIA